MAAAGRRDGHASKAGDKSDDDVACVACDYGFFTSPEDEFKLVGTELEAKYAPILVTKDETTGAVFADMVHQKGQDPWAIKQLTEHLVYLGHPKILFRSDGEPAIKSLLASVAGELKKLEVTVVPDQTPKGDSQAGGLQETAVAQIKPKVRCLWHHFCEVHGIKGAETHALLPWCENTFAN